MGKQKRRDKAPVDGPELEGRQDNEHDFWISSHQAARMCLMTNQWFHRRIRPLIEPGDVKKDHRSVHLHASAVVSAVVGYRVEQVEAKLTSQEIESAGTPDDEWMVRWRRARALICELEHAQLEGTLIPLSFVFPAVQAVCRRVTQAVSMVQTRLNRQDADYLAITIREAVNLACEQLDREIAKTPLHPPATFASEEPTPPAEEAPHAPSTDPKI
jgi:hypothetical protein